MAVHPWVAEAGDRPRWLIQLVLAQRPDALRELPRTAALVEQLGFHACLIFDHPLFHPDPFVALPVIAAATTRVRIGSAVTCVWYRHPLHLARLASDLDHVSGGRLILGLGVGNDEEEFHALGLPFPAPGVRVERVAETIGRIRDAWASGRITPPTQKPGPPIVIGGGGRRRTLRQVALDADACNVRETFAAEDAATDRERAASVRAILAALDAHCADVGRPPREIRRTHMTLFLQLSPSEAAAAAKLAASDTTRSTHPRTRRAGTRFISALTPSAAVSYYRAMRIAGIDDFIVQLDADDQETMRLLASEVVPHVR